MSAGKHPECSPDGCCINSIPARSGSCPNFLTKNQLCLRFSTPQPLALAGLDLGHPGTGTCQGVRGLQGWWQLLAAACLLSVDSIKREHHQGSATTGAPSKLPGASVSIWPRASCLGRDHPRHRPSTAGPAVSQPQWAHRAGSAQPGRAGSGGMRHCRDQEPTHIRAAGDSSGIIFSRLAVHYL